MPDRPLAGRDLLGAHPTARRRPAGTGHAARLIDANFEHPALLGADVAGALPHLLAERHVAGGAVYDALVALAARESGLPLATRDRRAASTYTALHVPVELVTD